MRRFEYAILREYRAVIQWYKSTFKFQGWVLIKDPTSNLDFHLKPTKKMNELSINLADRQKAWDEKWKGKSRPGSDSQEAQKERKEQIKISNEAEKCALQHAHRELSKRGVLLVDNHVLNLINNAGSDGWETTGKLPGSQSQGNFGLTMMRRMLN